MKRQAVDFDQIADWHNLQFALWKASRGKRLRPDVRRFLENAEINLMSLRNSFSRGDLPLHDYRSFIIHDPKKRTIVAVSFEMRIIHHAIMNIIGDNLVKSQIETSYACLPGRGTHRAVLHVQQSLRRFKWYVKIDVEHYFENIDHHLLKKKLRRRFKGKRFLFLLDSIIDSFNGELGKGLPIGSLTSQYCANFFLEQCDRYIQSLPEISGYVRYMDDMIWFCNDRIILKNSLSSVVKLLAGEKLKVKPQRQIQPVSHGVLYCGYRILPHCILLSRRKKRLYKKQLNKWQKRWANGKISDQKLQQCYDAIHGNTVLAKATGYRRKIIEQTGNIEV